jgi:uroporphyrinogen decarboxylase
MYMFAAERVEAVLRGERPDRPPFSFWYHFPAETAFGANAVRAHLDHLQAFQLDFLKVMNDNPYPHDGAIQSVEQLSSLEELGGDEAGFARQIELVAALRASLPERVPMITTIFNAWAVLRQLIQPPHEHHPPEYHGETDIPSRWIRDAWASQPQAVERALNTIAVNLARFAARCLVAGSDGIFLSVRDDWVDQPHRGLYRQLVEPLDRGILASASGARFNLLHVCGRAIDFRRFAEYPVHAINWADRVAGPSIAEVQGWLGRAICAGVDHERMLPDGSPGAVAAQVRDTIRQADGRPIMIAPGCTFDPARVPAENLHALAQAVRES